MMTNDTEAHGTEAGAAEPSSIERPGTRWRVIVWMNVVLGVLLWLGYCTDYSWVGTVPDYCFAVAVFLVALVSLCLRDKGQSKRTRWLYRMACLPGLIGGGLGTLLIFVVIILAFPLGVLFGLMELTNETLIQTSPSPDNSQVANVYFSAVGAYAGGNGRVYVRVRQRGLPLVERDVLDVSRSYAEESTDEYVRWKDADTLEIVGEPRKETTTVKVGFVQFKVPILFAIPINLVKRCL